MRERRGEEKKEDGVPWYMKIIEKEMKTKCKYTEL
jgi:hypothetical protein